MCSEGILKFWITCIDCVGINDGWYRVELFSGPELAIIFQSWHNSGKVHAGSLVERKEMVIVRNIYGETICVGTFQTNITALRCLACLWILCRKMRSCKFVQGARKSCVIFNFLKIPLKWDTLSIIWLIISLPWSLLWEWCHGPWTDPRPPSWLSLHGHGTRHLCG